jgi:hypothetical protein
MEIAKTNVEVDLILALGDNFRKRVLMIYG